MIPPRVRGAYCIAVGLGIAGIWAVLYASGDIPQLATAPLEIGYHLLAEGLTAAVLLIAGLGQLRGRSWAESVLLLAMGLLLYTVVNSAGYYAQRGEVAMVGMFTVLTVTTVGIVVDHLRGAASGQHGTTPNGGRPHA